MEPDELKARRERMGLSQEQLADEIGVSQQAVSLWESGRRPIPRTVSKLLAFVEAGTVGRQAPPAKRKEE